MSSVLELQFKEITASKYNPRKTFNEEKMTDLVASIKDKGVINPIIIRKIANKAGYELVCGERRFKAAQKAGLKTIPAMVRELTDQQALEFQVIENLQREDINPVEEAEGFNALLTQFKYTQDTLAKEIGKSQGYIAARLALLNLRADFKDDLIKGKLDPGHVKYLMICVKAEKVLDGIRKRLKEFKEQPTVRDFEVIANDAISRGTRDLEKQSWGGGGPDFDVKDCAKCEFNRSWKGNYGSAQKKCFNAECYRKKQAVARKTTNERIRAKIDKGQVVPEDQLKGVEELGGYKCKFDKKTCAKCANRKVVIAKDQYNNNKKVNKEVCTDKECFARKNKEHDELAQKKQQEEFKKTVAKIKHKASIAKIDRDFLAVVLARDLDADYENLKDAIIEAYGLDPEKLKSKNGMVDYFTRNSKFDLDQMVQFITYWQE